MCLVECSPVRDGLLFVSFTLILANLVLQTNLSRPI